MGCGRPAGTVRHAGEVSSTSVRVAAPPAVVFDYLAEPRNRARWQSSLRAVDVLTDGPTRVGTRWLDRTKVGASPCLEITAMTRPSATTAAGVWREVGQWRGLTASLTLTFSPVVSEPGSTDVGVRFSIAGRGAWQITAKVLRLLAPPAVRADLRRAARIIGSGPTTT